jgi:hypothetical protein
LPPCRKGLEKRIKPKQKNISYHHCNLIHLNSTSRKIKQINTINLPSLGEKWTNKQIVVSLGERERNIYREHMTPLHREQFKILMVLFDQLRDSFPIKRNNFEIISN